MSRSVWRPCSKCNYHFISKELRFGMCSSCFEEEYREIRKKDRSSSICFVIYIALFITICYFISR